MVKLILILMAMGVIYNQAYPTDKTGRIVAIENEIKLEKLINQYNNIVPAQFSVEKHFTLGNYGRYKNIGIEYELLRRNNKYPNEKEKEKGLRRFSYNNCSFIYMENERTKKFIGWLINDKKNDSVQ